MGDLLAVATRGSLCFSLLHIFIYGFSIIYLYLPGLPYVGATVEQLLDKGTRYLAAGQLSDALSLYVQAVDEDPKNYMTYFRRGTAYLALGNVRLALPDFEESIKLNGRFVPAIKQRANVYLKTGSIENARRDLDLLWTTYKDDESREKLGLLDTVESDLEQMNILYKNNNWRKALDILDRVVEVMPFCQDIREKRAQCYIRLNDLQKGIQEMRYGVRLLNDNRDGHLSLANLMYESGLAVQAIEEVRECLRLDQEHTGCKKLYRKLKKLSAAVLKAQSSLQATSYSDCINAANEVIALEPSNPEYVNQANVLLCQCHARSQHEDALSYCKEVAKDNPHNLDLQCDLAESYINNNQFDKGIEVCQTILEAERRHQRAKELLKKAQNLRKASKRPDYYKILGVSRSASKKEISRAYREQAKKWHPDNHPEKDKQKAQEKFMELTSAKDVLTDDDMRRRYDNGEDPLDPNNQQEHQQYGGPFGPFGGFTFANMHPFEGHFEFHFG